ncbi:MAG: regulatory protein GemA [Thermodesulfobacteriota bacterium]|nr:regulatory protein GemA [Thermodesulfobacteriota bacterium]
MPISNKKKALIHVAKAKIGMSETEYRDMLAGVGVASSKELNAAKFNLVIKHFYKLGFKRQKAKGRRKQAVGPVSSKDRLLGKVDAILADLGLKRGYADAIARNMFGIDAASWCNAHQLHKIVAALMYHQKRNKTAQKMHDDA